MQLPPWVANFGQQMTGYAPPPKPSGPPGFMGLNPMSGTPMGPSQFRHDTSHIGPPMGQFGGQAPAPMSVTQPPNGGNDAPKAPPVRPSPALAAWHAAQAPQGALGTPPPMPPERPAILGSTTPQQAPTNPWSAYNDSGNPADFVRANQGQSPDVPAPGASQAMAGPGSWHAPSWGKMRDMIDKNSVAGKLMQLSNPSPRTGGPQAQPAPEGFLPKLFGMFNG